MRSRAAELLRMFSTAVGVAAALSGCEPPRDVAGLAGTYVMNKSWNADTLQLRADGRYVRHFKSPNSPAVVDSGAWTLSRDAHRISIRAFPKRWAFVHDLMGDTTQGRVLAVPGPVTLTVNRSLRGTVRLGWYPDFDWWFVRLSE